MNALLFFLTDPFVLTCFGVVALNLLSIYLCSAPDAAAGIFFLSVGIFLYRLTVDGDDGLFEMFINAYKALGLEAVSAIVALLIFCLIKKIQKEGFVVRF